MTTIGLLTAVLSVLGLILLVPVGVLLIEVLAGRVLRVGPHALGARGRTAIAVIVPAHNEAAGISRNAAVIRGELQAADRLIVVADNCTDDTFDLARAAGADVIRRDDAARRGKGFALEFGVRHLQSDPPDVVVIMDADCEPAKGSIARIAEAAAVNRRAIQAYYGMQQPHQSASSTLPLAELAWRVKNWVRPSGLHRLGLPCQLMGTGMAFPWPLIASARLGSSDLVEDLVLGLELARNGAAPMFCPDAVVMSTFPSSEEGQSTQRARWETGHLQVIQRDVPRLLVEALRKRDTKLLALVLDAAVPPLALLALTVGAYALLALLWCLIAGAIFPLAAALLALTGLVVSILVGAVKATGDLRSLLLLASVPAYALAKVGIYSAVVARRQLEWIRTKRD